MTFDHDPVLTSRTGRIFELVTDGKTVWVNADDGMCVGRFSERGVDVHNDVAAQMETGRQCLACVHDLPPEKAWDVFRDRMAAHYGVDIPSGARPDFLDPDHQDDALPSP